MTNTNSTSTSGTKPIIIIADNNDGNNNNNQKLNHPKPPIHQPQQPQNQLSTKDILYCMVPLGIFIFAFTTIALAYHMTFRYNILQFQHIKTPPISMLMFAGPGRFIGQCGFPLVSLMFLIIAPRFFHGLKQLQLPPSSSSRMISTITPKPMTTPSNHRHPTPPNYKMIHILYISSIIAFVHLSVVGLIPLQRDILMVFSKRTHIGYDSMIHQTAAGIYFLCSIIHMVLYLYYIVRGIDVTHVLHYQSNKVSFYFKLCCLVHCFLPLGKAMTLHPASPIRHQLQLSDADSGGLQQYLLVLCIASYFASYSIELYKVERALLSSSSLSSTLN